MIVMISWSNKVVILNPQPIDPKNLSNNENTDRENLHSVLTMTQKNIVTKFQWIRQIKNDQSTFPNENNKPHNNNHTTEYYNMQNNESIVTWLSYISILCEKLQKIGNKFNIKTIFKTNNILRSLLSKTKPNNNLQVSKILNILLWTCVRTGTQNQILKQHNFTQRTV